MDTASPTRPLKASFLISLIIWVAPTPARAQAATPSSPPPAPKSIFDFDDPPRDPADAKPQQAAPIHVTVEVPPAAPTADAPTPVKPEDPAPPAPAPQPPSLLPVPDAKVQETALRQIKWQFAAEYRATGAQRVAAALALMKAAAADNGADATTSFVLLREARDMAAAAGDARTGLAAARQISGRYATDLTEMGLAVLMAAARGANTGANSADRAADVTEVALTLLRRATDGGQLELAARIAGIAEASARGMKSTPLVNNLQAIAKDLRARQNLIDHLPAAREALRKDAADAEACGVLGRQLCFVEGHWDEGLPFLAKGADPAIKTLAARDLAAPADATARADLANQWWTAAQPLPVTFRLRAQERAAHWYQLALPSLSGAKKDQAAARVAAAERVLTDVVLMQAPVAADPTDARRGRDALRTGAVPVAQDTVTASLTIDDAKPHAIAKSLSVPADNKERVEITLGPGAELRGGKLELAGKGKLTLNGTADNPAVLRNVQIGMDLGGFVQADYAVFDNCTFIKDGPWFSSNSSKWVFRNCVLYKCKFHALDGMDYGFKIDNCRLIGMTFPEITFGRDPLKTFNHLDHLRREWDHIAACEFDDCVVPPTVAWCAQDSSFIGCRFAPGEAFAGAEDFEWRAFVADTAGPSPQAAFDAKPAERSKVRYVPLDQPADVPHVGPRLIPEVTYATRAVARDE